MLVHGEIRHNLSGSVEVNGSTPLGSTKFTSQYVRDDPRTSVIAGFFVSTVSK